MLSQQGGEKSYISKMKHNSHLAQGQDMWQVVCKKLRAKNIEKTHFSYLHRECKNQKNNLRYEKGGLVTHLEFLLDHNTYTRVHPMKKSTIEQIKLLPQCRNSSMHHLHVVMSSPNFWPQATISFLFISKGNTFSLASLQVDGDILGANVMVVALVIDITQVGFPKCLTSNWSLLRLISERS